MAINIAANVMLVAGASTAMVSDAEKAEEFAVIAGRPGGDQSRFGPGMRHCSGLSLYLVLAPGVCAEVGLIATADTAVAR